MRPAPALTGTDPATQIATAPERDWGEIPSSEVNYKSLTRDEVSLVRAVAATMAFVIFACKLAIPPNIEVSFFVVIACTAWLFWKGYAAIEPLRALGLLTILTLAMAVNIFSPAIPHFSVTSVLFLVAIHMPFLFVANVRRIVYLNILKWIAFFCAIIAFMVYFQWAQQIAGFKPISMEDYIHKGPFIFDNYNYIQKIDFYARYYKPNGFFMLETSHCSQLLAIGILIELCILRRIARFAFLAVAMASTFGGTGILMLVVAAPVVLLYLRPRELLGVAIAIPLVLATAVQLGVAQNVLMRSTEFDKTNSSGNGRFIRPWIIMAQTLEQGADTAMFGIGGGTDNKFMVYKRTDILPPAIKVITEYGIPVGLLYLVWFHAIVFTARVPVLMTVAALMQFDAVGGALLIPLETYYVFFLSAFLVPRRMTTVRSATPLGAERPNWAPRWAPKRLAADRSTA